MLYLPRQALIEIKHKSNTKKVTKGAITKDTTQLTFTCSKSTVAALEKVMKYVQN